MVVARYSHSFSKCQLQIIIDGYLHLGPYYSVLLKVLRSYTQRYERQSDMHPCDKPHPIRIYAKDYLCAKNLLQEVKSVEIEQREMRSTQGSSSLKYYYIYPLECVIEMLESEQFYKLVPSDIIINGLFTETNLRIIIESLKIVSEDMSKKVRSTIAGKEIRKDDSIRFDQVVQVDQISNMKINELKSQMSYQFTSKVEIPLEEDDEVVLLQPKNEEISRSRPIKKEIVGTSKFVALERDFTSQQCGFCQGYLIYVYDTIGENPSDDDINRLSEQSVRCLRLIANIITHFTLYLTETGQTLIKNDINLINKILHSLGLVITQDIFSSELNPKNKTTKTQRHKKLSNLIQDLEPYFWMVEQKKTDEKYFSLEELFRMVIYSPTTLQVKDQLKIYHADHFQRDPVLKSYQKEERVKQLLKKQCQDMKQFQNQRLKIVQNTVNVKPVYKQLHFQQCTQPRFQHSQKPNSYNVFNANKTIATKKSLNDKSQTLFASYNGIPINVRNENRTLMADLSNSISRVYLDKKQSKKKLQKKGSQNLQHSKLGKYDNKNFLIESSNAIDFVQESSISKTLKKSIIKYNHTNQKTLTISTEGLQHNGEKSFEKLEGDELNDKQFRKILYNAYTRNNGLIKNDYAMGNTLNGSTISVGTYLTVKSTPKKNGVYSSNLTSFIGRRQEQEQIECIEKKQKQVYNKQQLNGFFVRNQIYDQIKKETALIYEDYHSINPLPDNHHFQRKGQRNETKLNETTIPRSNKESSKLKYEKNIIFQNRTKFNQSGIIRNEKYNKSIKSQLINHRQTFILAQQKQNQIKMAQEILKKKQSGIDKSTTDIRQRYENELRALEYERKMQNQSMTVLEL